MPNAQSPDALVSGLATLGNTAIGGAQLFGTFTFRDPPPSPGSPHFTSIGHGGAVRAMTGYLRGLADTYPGVAAFVAMEPHQDRVAPHFHALLAGLDPDVRSQVELGRRGRPTRARGLLWEPWYRDHGIARIEAVDGDGAALYVAKYSLKGGSQVPWWEVWEPGALRQAWVNARRTARGRR